MSEPNIGMFPPLLLSSRVKKQASSHASVNSASENKVNNDVTTTATRKKSKLRNDAQHTIEEVNEKLESAKTYIDNYFQLD